jgi:membrane protease YdiL (CAAX protease family)
VHRLKLLFWVLLVAVPTALNYAARATGEEPDDDVLYRYSTAVAAGVIYLVLLGLVLAIAGSDRQLLALRRPRSWKRAAALSAAAFVSVFVVIALLEQVLQGGEEQGLTPDGWQPEHAGAYAANFVVIALVAPVVEELMFRGLGYSLLEQFGRVVAIVAVGVAFGLNHGLVEGLPALVLFGCTLAWLRSATDSVYPCIILHALFNAIALVAAVSV